MDEDMILKCIDSLWFFSNLLTPSPPFMLFREKPKRDQQNRQRRRRMQNPTEIQNVLKGISTEQSRAKSNQKQTTNFEAQNQICTMNCGEMGSEARRPVSANQAHRRMRRTHIMERFVTPLNCNYALPSFSDSLAMKAHLKSWAQAVACTVR